MNKNRYDPLPDILEQFRWAVKAARRFKGTPDEAKFIEIALHLERELRKYLIKE